jgi:hypothetical protein
MPDIIYMGLDTAGAWYSPPHKGILQAASQWTDALFAGGWLATSASGDAEGSAKSLFLSDNFTAGPLLNFMVLTSNAGQYGGVNCGGNFPCLTTEAAKGQYWYDIISHELSYTGTDGKFHWGGLSWWSLYPFHGGQNADFGLKTAGENAYDGHEAVVSSVACSAPLAAFTCGGEPSGAWNGQDAIGTSSNGLVLNANSLWFGGSPSSAVPTVLAPGILSRNIDPNNYIIYPKPTNYPQVGQE